MEKVTVSLDLLQKIVDYLAQKPYVEVFQLIARIQQEINGQEAKKKDTENISEVNS